MADTYDELKRRIQLLIDRDDAETQVAEDGTSVDMLDVFIANAEKRFYRSEAARIPPLEKFDTFEVEKGTGVTELSIPSDYFETRYLTAEDDNSTQITLARTSPEQILNVNTSQSLYSIPREFAYGNNVWLVHTPNQDVTVTANYYGFLDPLDEVTDSSTRHWILNNADDLIMYWSGVEASLYYSSLSGMTELWEQRGTFIHDQIVEQEIRQQQSGSTPKSNRPSPYRSRSARRY